jgi:catechol 2,3-dioxygenase-like lactoylglutathione lyase family enzyme
MESAISQMIDQYEQGRLTRRDLVTGLTAVLGIGTLAGGTARSAVASEPESTFRATSLNHIALRTTDVVRSRDFYVRHLGLEVANESLPQNSFLNCGPHFLALFRASEPGMDHYCYSVPDYDQQQAAKKLRAVGLEPQLAANRIYFDDPDGLTVQLASEDHGP